MNILLGFCGLRADVLIRGCLRYTSIARIAAIRFSVPQPDSSHSASRNDKKSVPLAIASAQVSIQGKTASAKSTAADAREIVLTVPLTRGVTQMQAWFRNSDGTDLAGAFYAYVRPVSSR